VDEQLAVDRLKENENLKKRDLLDETFTNFVVHDE